MGYLGDKGHFNVCMWVLQFNESLDASEAHVKGVREKGEARTK